MPIEAEKKLALVQPLMEGDDDLQTSEQIPVALKTHSGLHSLFHCGNLPGGLGHGVYLWFSFSPKEGNGSGRGVSSVCHPPGLADMSV